MVWEIPIGPMVEAGWELYKEQARVVEFVLKVRHLIEHGVLRIAVVGPGGVGKSEMGRFFSLPDPATLRPTDYTQSVRTEKQSLHGKWGGLLIAPGQEDHFVEDWDQIYGFLATGECRVVINVVAWGYHSIGRPYSYQEVKYDKDVKDEKTGSTIYKRGELIYKPGESIADFLGKYLPACRRREEDQLEKLQPRLIAAKEAIWMLTLVVKQDIWWLHSKDVREHYENGRYGAMIRNIQEQREKEMRRFVHDFLPVSLVLSNFRDGRGEILDKTAQGFDQNMQQPYQVCLLEKIEGYAQR